MEFLKFCQDGKLMEVTAELESGQDPNMEVVLDHGHISTPLAEAILCHQNDVIELLLLQENININWIRNDGMSILHIAVASENDFAVDILVNENRSKITTLNHKTYSNDGDEKSGMTPLMLAMSLGYIEIVYIVGYVPGVDWHTMDDEGHDLEGMAMRNENKGELLDTIFDIKGDISDHAYFVMKEFWLANGLISESDDDESGGRDEGGDITEDESEDNDGDRDKDDDDVSEVEDGSGTSVEHEDDDEMINESEDEHRKFQWDSSFSSGMKFFNFCKSGNMSGVKAALRGGMNVNWRDLWRADCFKGMTGLLWAIRSQHSEVANILLDHGSIDINVSNDIGVTALHYACAIGDTAIITRLLEDSRLTTLNSQASDGWTPIMVSWLL